MSKFLRNIQVLGSALSLGQTLQGVDKGPHALRQFGLMAWLKDRAYEVNDLGDIHEKPKELPGASYKALFDRVVHAIDKEDFALVLGGDHSLSIGSLSALLGLYPDLKVLWVDAHGDMNTPKTSPTGSLHGMPLAAMMGWFRLNAQEGMEWFTPRLKPENLALIGVRDLDPGERNFIREHNITAVSAEEVHDRGMTEVVEDVLETVDPQKDSPIHLSFDIDSVDPAWAKATGIWVPNGLTLEHVKELGAALAKTKRVVSTELVELNPLIANNAEELAQSIDVIFTLLDSLIRQPFHGVTEAGVFPLSLN